VEAALVADAVLGPVNTTGVGGAGANFSQF
jgi:hypothetical protein